MMTEPVDQTPLAIDRVERARAKHDQVRLRVSGRWLTDARAEQEPTLLVVQLHGRRLRFPAGDDAEDAPGATAGGPFAASFTVPDWAVPEQPGQAVLWVGEAVVAVPPPGMAPSAPLAPPPEPPVATESGSTSVSISASAPAGLREAGEPVAGPIPGPASSGRSGPLAELLHKETVAALHAELEQRTAESARLRSALAAVRSDLQGGSSARAELESAHGELREELQRLMGVASDQRDEFEQRLAAAEAERERLTGELAAADAERERLTGELAAADAERERLTGELAGSADELERVRTALADAVAEHSRAAERQVELGAELARVREAGEDRLAAARSDFDQRLAGARSEAEAAITAVRGEAEAAITTARAEADQTRAQADAELSLARSETEAMLAAARGHSDSRVTAAEAQIAQLSERIVVLQGDERRRFDEVSGLREQLAAAQISRDAALGEADGLRAELDRLGAELAVLREQSGPPGGDLSEARQLLADARALTQRLRGDSAA